MTRGSQHILGSGGAPEAAWARGQIEAAVDRIAGALLGTFVGDALGMPWEGRRGDDVPDVLEMRDARLGRGTYTDDTQMMIAVAESLLRCDVVDEEDLARTFLAHADRRRGYGAGTLRVLESVSRGTPVAQAAAEVFEGRGSLGNGAAMRVAPVAVRFHPDRTLVVAQARRSARVTHTHPVGIDGAAVQAAAVAAALADDEPLRAAAAACSTAEVRRALDDVCARTRGRLDPAALRATTEPGVSARADDSVAAAVVAGSRASDFEQALTVAIRAGGDTDTVGAMAGAIAGARFGASAIPRRWLDALEDGERGRSHVETLAEQLAERSLSPDRRAPAAGPG
ncbi:MAG TPA: ADP-ribosylglycohydrolase family protein [Solirubrobacteraceae bacterium]|nr:ADP-ribosylglycohydrolase family protein [Solirubrobacteraceae bacterium]